MFSVVVLQWIRSEKTRPRVAPLHTHYVLQKNSASRARGSSEKGNGQIFASPEGQLAIQQSYPSVVDRVGESRECEERAKTNHLGNFPSALSEEGDNSNCKNKNNEREEGNQKQQTAAQEIDV